jgi:uncharacterized protein (DUF58 family)
MELIELIKKVKELELVAQKNAFSILSGEYVTTLPGRGLMFHEARKYVPGESIRMIDWNMTARLGEPYVKVLLEEREREVMIALDVSPSMKTGWQDKTKLEYAVELAATLAVSAVGSRDKVGYILFNDRTVSSALPKSGKLQLFRTLKAMLQEMDKEADETKFTDIRSVFHEIQKNKNKRYIVFIISDFIDRDIPEDLKYARAEHDISFMHIYDPLEYEITHEILIPAFSPEREDGKVNRGIISPGETGSLESMQSFLKTQGIKYRISVDSFSTKDQIYRKLKDFFHKKKRRTL